MDKELTSKELEELKKAEMSKGLGSLIDEAEEINEIRLALL